jgi:hypothetical protein
VGTWVNDSNEACILTWKFKDDQYADFYSCEVSDEALRESLKWSVDDNLLIFVDDKDAEEYWMGSSYFYINDDFLYMSRVFLKTTLSKETLDGEWKFYDFDEEKGVFDGVMAEGKLKEEQTLIIAEDKFELTLDYEQKIVEDGQASEETRHEKASGSIRTQENQDGKTVLYATFEESTHEGLKTIIEAEQEIILGQVIDSNALVIPLYIFRHNFEITSQKEVSSLKRVQ